MSPDRIAGSQMPQPRELRFSVDDYYKMIEMGMIDDYERSEIIDGRMIKKMTIGDKHAAAVDFLTRLLIQALPDQILVRVQNPLRMSDFDELEPDIVLADLTKYDGRRHPTPAVTLLVVEVADASLKFDRDVKLTMYADAGIPEVWIVNIPHDLIEVHTEPAVGLYRSTNIYRKGETVVSTVLSEIVLPVDSILS
jgi:Uma2 family endonuclease